MDQIIIDFIEAIGNARTLGVLGTMLAVVLILVRFTKLPVLDPFFAKRKWLRAVLAVVLGILSGVLPAAMAGAPWLSVVGAGVAAGLLAGASAIGLEQALSRLLASGRDKEAIASRVEALVAAGDSAAEEAEAFAKDLASAAAVPPGKARRQALAEYAKRRWGSGK